MTITIKLNANQLQTLDLSPAQTVIEKLLQEENIIIYEQKINFEIDFPRDVMDPRELSEIAEVRLWFIRLDAVYPWLPFLLDWKGGELARYVAMLVPHQFSSKEGIQYNPEALEIMLMSKIFALGNFLQKMSIPHRSRLQSMAKMLGYDLDEEFFNLLD
jgi:hypothetical protein